jgi:tetratricopeptide (TPR) repeat protein
VVFDFRSLFARIASLTQPATPLDAALRAMRLGRYDDALDRLNALLGSGELSNDERLFAENKRGVALVSLDRREEARAVFDNLLAADPGYAPALVNLGNMDLENGEVEAAVARYESAVRFDDFYAMAHFNLGVAYKRLGRTSDAVREFKRAQSLEGRARQKPSKRS